MDAIDKISIEEIFPYDEMREQQEKGIGTVFDTCDDGGFVLLEGACGTGKTLLSLCPLLSIVENRDDIDRIVIATSVKQQQTPIENEIRKINENTRKNFTAVSLVGKADMCSFVDGGKISRDSIYNRCDELREGTIEIKNTTHQSYSDLSKSAEEMNQNKGGFGQDDSKFSNERIPRDEVTQNEFCPFYAEFLNRKGDDDKPNTPFNGSNIGLVDPEDILKDSTKEGICPYSVMSEMTTKADVIVCNYYHIFDSRTSKSMMNDLIGDNTLVVLDEAHNLVEKTRELMTKTQSVASIRNTIKEMKDVEALLSIDRNRAEKFLENKWKKENKKYIESKAENMNTSFETTADIAQASIEAHNVKDQNNIKRNHFIEVIKIYEKMLETLDKILENEKLEDYGEVPLRKPEDISQDKLTTWLDIDPHRKKNFKSRGAVLKTVSQALKTIHVDIISSTNKVPDLSTNKTISFWDSWMDENNKDYFRSLNIREKYRETGDEKYEWEKEYKVYLTMNNCLPKSNISSMITEFAGGVLMSATLEPLEVFKRETGLDEKDIKTVSEKFGLSFPKKKRKSLSVDLPKYKYGNRGPSFKNGEPNMNSVRRKYIESIIDFVESVEGNSMVAMQSYPEAKWAYEMIQKRTEIDSSTLILDESSSNRETESKKQEFYSGGKKILITGARGTLVEGVDYMGEKLRGIAVCGVPLRNTNNPVSKAIKASYEKEFGRNNGFDYAFTVPAVRKSRQTIGRLIRSEDDYGVRVLIDERYCDKDNWDSVRGYLSEQEQEEFKDIDKTTLKNEIQNFFEGKN